MSMGIEQRPGVPVDNVDGWPGQATGIAATDAAAAHQGEERAVSSSLRPGCTTTTAGRRGLRPYSRLII